MKWLLFQTPGAASYRAEFRARRVLPPVPGAEWLHQRLAVVRRHRALPFRIRRVDPPLLLPLPDARPLRHHRAEQRLRRLMRYRGRLLPLLQTPIRPPVTAQRYGGHLRPRRSDLLTKRRLYRQVRRGGPRHHSLTVNFIRQPDPFESLLLWYLTYPPTQSG